MNTAPAPSLTALLAAPFNADEIRWKPRVVRGGRALAVAYIDARVVEDRLDAIFGPGGWQDRYSVLPSGNVVCTLRVCIEGQWIEKTDVGGMSAQPEEGNRIKAAFSDALKRAAVKLGIGRYVYRIAAQWMAFDEKAKRFTQMPVLPSWALPPSGGKIEATEEQGRISPEQWEQVKKALASHGVAARKLLDHFKVQKPSELLAAQFKEALALASRPPHAWLNGKTLVG